MFRGLRRLRQLLSEDETKNILLNGNTGILAVNGDDGYPYTIPLCYVYDNNSVYFHTAINGHKIDALKKDSKVSFCVIGEDRPYPEKFTALYKSAVVFGKADFIEDEKEKMLAMKMLVKKYSPELVEKGMADAELKSKAYYIVKINVEHICGKQSIELVK